MRNNITAPNRQFGASGGVVSWDTSQNFGSLPPVRALPIPPPAAKLPPRWLQASDSAVENFLQCDDFLKTLGGLLN